MKRDERLPTRRESPADFLIYQTESGATKIEVRLDNETVWLTSNLMAALFQTTKQNISQHIQAVYAAGELTPEATVKKYLTVQLEAGQLCLAAVPRPTPQETVENHFFCMSQERGRH